MRSTAKLGPKVRLLRRRHSLTQTQLAKKLGISPSYLNLIEHNRRPLSASLLLRMAQLFELELHAFVDDDTDRLISELLEVFSDDLFESEGLIGDDLRELAAANPALAAAVVKLYQAYDETRESLHSLGESLPEGLGDTDGSANILGARLPSDVVTAALHRHHNYFPELEDGAESLRRDLPDDGGDLFNRMARYLERHHGVIVKIEMVGAMGGAVRRYDHERRRLLLSEVLRRGSRNFQLAHQIGLLTQGEVIDHLVAAEGFVREEERALARLTLANYFAGATLMPYRSFLAAAQSERYDIELLTHRFRTSFEQVCHRLTTLRRPGAEGLPFHLVRVDVAGNISKRYSNTALTFARFGAGCPRWNVFKAFMTPGRICTQLSQMPDGRTFLDIACTVKKEGGGFHAPYAVHAVGVGCPIEAARGLVYADGIDLDLGAAVVPIGMTCRLCERKRCEQRATPSVHHALRLDPNVRGVSFYAPVD